MWTEHNGVDSKWERNENWAKDIWLIVLTLALVTSMFIGFIGWVRYRDSEKLRMENEMVIGNFFETIE